MIARSFFISCMMVLASLSVGFVKPAPIGEVHAPPLDAMMPDAFGEWSRIHLNDAILPTENEQGPGEATAYRAYRDALGRVVTVVVAYGPPLGDSVRLHRPESCYVAQGFEIRERHVKTTTTRFGAVPLVHLDTRSASRNEAVSYWLRDGEDYITDAAGHQLLAFMRKRGDRSDGALVRVSSTGNGQSTHDWHAVFLNEFSAALNDEARYLMMAGQ